MKKCFLDVLAKSLLLSLVGSFLFFGLAVNTMSTYSPKICLE